VGCDERRGEPRGSRDRSEEPAEEGSEAVASVVSDRLTYTRRRVLNVQLHSIRLQQEEALANVNGTRKRREQERLEYRRHRLEEDMAAWRTASEGRNTGDERASADSGNGEEDVSDRPHNEGPVLGLPSEYSEADRRAYGLQAMGSLELLVRKGLAFDLIAKIRQKAVEQALSKATNHAEAGSSAVVTRAKGRMQRMQQVMMDLVDVYNRNWQAMVALGEQEGVLKAIRKSNGDLAHNTTTTSCRRVDAQREEGWIWSVGAASMLAAGLEEAAWEGAEDMGE
jgi:hypothetical protein